MAQKKVLLEELQALDNLKDLAENYEEIAAKRMERIKDSVIQSRDFLTELSEVFVDIKSSYQREVTELLKKRKGNDKSAIPIYLQKKGKLLMVYMSSNGRLYGPVTKKTFNLFIEDLKKKEKGNEKFDILIIGSAGKEMFENSSYQRPFEFANIPDDKIEIEHIKTVVKKFLEYENVHVYHGKFLNVMRQTAVASSITGDDIFETEVPSEVSQEDMFIFEPELEKLIHFFETQIMSTLFRQTYYENQLARQASRVNAMEEALIHIEEETKKLQKQKIRIKHIIQNKKQLETMSGFSIWNVV